MKEEKRFFVKPKIKTRWFRNPVVVYQVMLEYSYWYDPSAGNGGGDFRKAVVKLCTCKTREEADALVNQAS